MERPRKFSACVGRGGIDCIDASKGDADLVSTQSDYPAKKIIPASRVSAEEALRAFLDSQEQVRPVIRESAGLDLNRIRWLGGDWSERVEGTNGIGN